MTEINKYHAGIKAWFQKFKSDICEKLQNSVTSNPSFKETMIFGPVPSRRLGLSLGINNMCKKTCTYDCIYCQAGNTSLCSTTRGVNLSPYELYFCVNKRLEELKKENIEIEYISFIPNGEPSLDLNLSQQISILREFGYKIAVFTNASLLWNRKVQENLLFADYVSVKVDTLNENTWYKLNRPHMRLRYDLVLDGIKQFAKEFSGELTTETMLIKGFNDSVDEVHEIGKFLNTLNCKTSFFTTPVRPPAKKYAVAPDVKRLNELSEYIRKEIPASEILFKACKSEYKTAGNIENEILNIMSVHPINYDSLENMYQSQGGSSFNIKDLLDRGIIKEKIYNDESFFYKGETVESY